MALLTTIPARETIPIPVIMMTKSILKMAKPKNTPMVLNSTVIIMMMGLKAELNCDTNIKVIKATAIIKALDKKS